MSDNHFCTRILQPSDYCSRRSCEDVLLPGVARCMPVTYALLNQGIIQHTELGTDLCFSSKYEVWPNTPGPIHLKLLNVIQSCLLCLGADGVTSKINVTHCLCKNLGFDGTNISTGIFIQQRISANGHNQLCILFQISRRIEFLELVQSNL